MQLSTTQLTPEQTEAFGRELDAIAERVQAQLGEEDARYIRRLMRTAKNLDLTGRALLMASFFPPAWLAGTALLGVAKILDNMEIGHNVMHGQYDFMRDEHINSDYEWDTVCPGDQWRHSHNYVHHTFTNVIGVDDDVGYGITRLSEEQPWQPKSLLNLSNTFLLATLFQWGVGAHDSHVAELWQKDGKTDWKKFRKFLRKAGRQTLKDYVLFPLLAGPMALPVFLGNLTANLIRNYWAWAVIFCGHFPDGTCVFTEEQIEGETRGQWYARQVLGSCNIEGSKLLYLMTGHLSHQIEHHLFPTLPAWRYPQVAAEVRATCEKYGLPYHTGPMHRQVGQVIRRIGKMSLPRNWAEVRRAFERPEAAALPAGATLN